MTPTYNVLKEEKYKSILVKVGLGGVLEMLPLVSEEKGVEGEQQQGTSSSIVGEKPLPLMEEPHQDILEEEERPPSQLKG